MATETNLTQEQLLIQENKLKLKNFEDSMGRIENPTLVAFAALGLLSSILTLVTLCWNKEFKEPCFICYKAIAICGVCFALSFAFYFTWLSMGAFHVHQDLALYASRDIASQWVLELNMHVLLTPFREAIGFIMIFLSSERAIAVFLPTKFYLVDKRSVCFSVVAFAMLTQLGVNLQHVFTQKVVWDDKSKGYITVSTNSAIDDLFENIKTYTHMGLSLAVLISAALAVAALIKGFIMKKRLFKVINPTSPIAKTNMALAKKNLQLCYLQLCQAVPLVVSNIFLFFATSAWWQFPSPIDFEINYINDWLWLVTYFMEVMAHCFHFFLYMTFSETFRKAFLKRIRKQ